MIQAYLAHCRERALLDVLVRTNEADQHLHRFYSSIGFTKLDITVQQELPMCGVTKRYFRQSLR